MSHLVGATISIPGDAWHPQQDKPVSATVTHFARATRGYPEGRVRIFCEDGTELWWDVSKLPSDWVVALAEDPAAFVAATPSRGRRSAATTPGTTGRRRGRPRTRTAADGYDSTGAGGMSDTDGAGAASTLTLTAIAPTPDRMLSPAGATTSAVVTATPVPGPLPTPTPPPIDTTAAAPSAEVDVLSDDGADAGARTATGGVRRRGRPRKSLRFAPGTISPGAQAAAAAATSVISSPYETQAQTRDLTPTAETKPLASAQGFSSPVVYLTSPLSPLTSPRSSDGGAAAAAASAAKLHGPGYDTTPPTLSLVQRLRNTALILLVTLPAIYFHRQLHYGCSAEQRQAPLQAVIGGGGPGLLGQLGGLLGSLLRADLWCALGFQQPLLAVNLVFFLNVDVLFWYISLLQGSTWLIDPFWTIAPVLIGLFYQFHPAATAQPLRSRLAMGLLWVWAVRLTHSYFRREEWQVGAREDWRYARMARRLGRLRWAVVSFFTVGVTQHLMLVGISLPLLAIHTSAAAWNPLVDVPIFLAAATGIMIALVADNQLRDFMLENEQREQQGRPKLLLLDTGLWRYSRHPNFFGEQLWWWSLALWAVVCGQPWMLVGAAFNTLCFIPITKMNEERMLERPERAQLYRHYQMTTSVWVPWPRRAVSA